MQFRISSLATLLAVAGLASATLEPCKSNAKGYKPKSQTCQSAGSSDDIQAAECSHNTRTSEQETFAVWTRTKTNSNGISYGTCEAFTCTAPSIDDLEKDADSWVFYWSNIASSLGKGPGTGPIRDPNSGAEGCENSDGEFVVGNPDSCS